MSISKSQVSSLVILERERGEREKERKREQEWYSLLHLEGYSISVSNLQPIAIGCFSAYWYSLLQQPIGTAYCIWSVIQSHSLISISCASSQWNLAKDTQRIRERESKTGTAYCFWSVSQSQSQSSQLFGVYHALGSVIWSVSCIRL